MNESSKLESYEFAERCLWEAERTLDREVAQSLRALANRYRRMSQRSVRLGEARPTTPTPTPRRELACSRSDDQ
jgi:hypothetical protein